MLQLERERDRERRGGGLGSRACERQKGNRNVRREDASVCPKRDYWVEESEHARQRERNKG